MNNKDYQTWAKTLDREDEGYIELAARLKETPNLLRMMHMVMGMSGETGEVVDIIKKAIMYGTSIDKHKLLNEMADATWYKFNLLTALGATHEEMAQLNYEKLSKRYASGSFSEKEAIERKDLFVENKKDIK